MKKDKVKLLDITFDLNLVNIRAVSKASKFSYTYTRQLITGQKKNALAQLRLRNTIVRLYGSIIKFVHCELNIQKTKAA